MTPPSPDDAGPFEVDPRRQKQRATPILTGESLPAAPKTRIKGVRVTYDVGGGEEVATQDHPTARSWSVTKQGQLVLRDDKKRQVARYRQFVWRSVATGDIRVAQHEGPPEG